MAETKASVNVVRPRPRRLERPVDRSDLATAGDGGHQEDAVAFFEGAGFPAEEADVLFVEVDVEELADLALIVADVTRETGEARRELVQGLGDGRGTTVDSRRAIGEAAEGGGNLNGDWHVHGPLNFP